MVGRMLSSGRKELETGDQISWKLAKSEPDGLIQWLNAQVNRIDSIRYLIMNDIHQNGIRDVYTNLSPVSFQFSQEVKPPETKQHKNPEQTYQTQSPAITPLAEQQTINETTKQVQHFADENETVTTNHESATVENVDEPNKIPISADGWRRK